MTDGQKEKKKKFNKHLWIQTVSWREQLINYKHWYNKLIWEESNELYLWCELWITTYNIWTHESFRNIIMSTDITLGKCMTPTP